MPDRTRKLYVAEWRKKRLNRRDWTILAWSLLVHLLAFLLLPQLSTEAAAVVALQIELVEPQPRLAPSRPVTNPAGPVPMLPDSPPQPTTDTAASSSPAQKPAAEPADSAGQSATSGKQQAETEPSAHSMPAVPDVISTPTHQPRKVDPPQPQNQPPAPAGDARDSTKPPTPDSAAKEPDKPAAAPADASADKPADIPAPPAASDSKEPAKPDPAPPAQPQPGQGNAEPSTQADPEPGAGVPNDGPPTPPPGPSALELGLLDDYGDYARKKIRSLSRNPERSVEQGLKGKVVFEFEIASDGTLLKTRVVDSSGHGILDEECLEATRVAAPFKRFPANIKVSSWIFKMELKFPLY
jgi:TonB family protein